jgi:hypothetical protein
MKKKDNSLSIENIRKMISNYKQKISFLNGKQRKKVIT